MASTQCKIPMHQCNPSSQLCCSATARPTPRLVVRAECSGTHRHQAPDGAAPLVSRRGALAAATAAVLLTPGASRAFQQPPPGFRLHVDRLDGYEFVYPELWTQVTSSGNDIFLRSVQNVEDNLFVDITSPSSSRYASVTDLGTPREAAEKLLDQYLNKEFMSTRLGVRREAEVVGAEAREGPGGRTYFDIDIRITSYASRNPYSSTQSEVMGSYGAEWDRRLLTTLGVANRRLYQMRLQTSVADYPRQQALYETVQRSFRVREVEA